MDLDQRIDDVAEDVMALSDMCDRRGLTLTERVFHDLIASLQAERQRRSAAPIRSDAEPTRTNVVIFVPRGAQAPMTGTFLPVLGSADDIA